MFNIPTKNINEVHILLGNRYLFILDLIHYVFNYR